MIKNPAPASSLFLLLVFATSCFKEDDRVTPVNPGDVTVKQIEMLPDYSIISYFDLSSDSVVLKSLKSDWDLGLTCQPGDYTLYLNTARFMRIAHTASTRFDSTWSTTDADWKFDESTGSVEGNAIGTWWTQSNGHPAGSGEVLLVDRGINDEGLPAGYLKIQPQIDSLTGLVSVRIANTDGSDERSFTFVKNGAYAITALSFDTGLPAKQPFPAKDAWDLVFTQYTTLLFTDDGEPYPYLVTGVLINDTLVEAVMDSVTGFDRIDRAFAERQLLSSRKDVIGYDWKKLIGDVNTGNVSYEPRPEMVYIIRNRDGYYFKLRFTGFYSNTGQKGYPTFEYQRL